LNSHTLTSAPVLVLAKLVEQPGWPAANLNVSAIWADLTRVPGANSTSTPHCRYCSTTGAAVIAVVLVGRVLHELGEHHQLMIASGRREAAVYAMLEEPEGPPQEPAAAGAAAAAAHAAEDGPAAAAADGAAADGELEEAEEALGAANQQRAAAFQAWLQDNPPYQQLQLLDQPVPPTESTPPQLGAVRIPQYKLGFPVVPVAGGVVMPDNGQVPCLAEARPLYLALPPVNPATGRPFPLMLLCRTNATWFQVRPPSAPLGGAVPLQELCPPPAC